MRRLAEVLLACLLLSACGEPKDAAGWAKRAVQRARTDEKLQALDQVRRAPGDRHAAVPWLVEVLRQGPRVRAEAAIALGEFGDPAAVGPLLTAVEPEARDRETQDANRQIAVALGALRAREAIPVLARLTGSPDGFTQVAAVDAVGQIGDPAGVEPLVAVATSQAVEPFTARKALLALGRIGDPRAAPVVLRLLFEQRGGASLYSEAAFAASQIGPPMAPLLLAVLEGKDAEVLEHARAQGIAPGAVQAKVVVLLGLVGGTEAVPPLVARLSYRDPDPELERWVRRFAATALGALRAREAVKPLGEVVTRATDQDLRDRACEALALIGDPAALPALRAVATGTWTRRAAPLAALSRLGGPADQPLVEAAARSCPEPCPAGQAEALAGMRERLAAAATCGDVRCWAGKLGDASAAVRDRAALEVGRGGSGADAAALVEAAERPVDGDATLAVRTHAVLAVGWIAARGPVPDGPALADRLERVIAQERGRTLTAAVNEEAFAVATRLRRGR